MKIAFLVDSPHSDASKACGVGDYTYQISRHLEALSVETRVFDRVEWNKKGTLGLLRELKSFQADILHIQYPTIGYVRAFIAPMIAAAHPAPHVVLTAHEFIRAHPARKICIGFMARNSSRVIFPSEFERRSFLTRYPEHENKSQVIPIGSNIAPPSHDNAKARDPNSVLYFGLIKPEKGLEDFIRLAEIAYSDSRNYKFRIVGTPHPNHAAYYKSLRDKASKLPIIWNVGCTPEQVRDIFSTCTYAYLPFPDGASERRGSLLAVLSHGLAAVTTSGAQTPETMRDALTFAENPSDALSKLDMLAKEPRNRDDKSKAGERFAAGFSWENIAEKHLSVYNAILLLKADDKAVFAGWAGNQSEHLKR